MLNDELLSYFSLSLWSVRLEAANVSGNCILIGDDDCSIITQANCVNTSRIAEVLKHWDTVSLAQWYETYYNLAFGRISLTDNSEVARNVVASFCDSLTSDEIALVEVNNVNVSVEVQPPDESYQTIEQSIHNLYSELDRTRPRFLYADKNEIEGSYISDRVIVVLNVMSDVDYVPPLGWSFRPFDNTVSICIPLTMFEGLGVYDQISLAQDFLTFKGDKLIDTLDIALDTHDLIPSSSKSIQTDPTLAPNPNLISPPLNFDRHFQPLHNYNNHVCRCMACNTFLYEFLQEWGLDVGIIRPDNTEGIELTCENAEIARAYTIDTPIYDVGDYNNNVGGNYKLCYASHTTAEAKTAKRSVDMDRLSQSSPEIESSSSSSSDTVQQELPPKIKIETPPAVPPSHRLS